jgi:hypothetical protein
MRQLLLQWHADVAGYKPPLITNYIACQELDGDDCGKSTRQDRVQEVS